MIDLWATAETLEVQPLGLARFRHRGDLFQRASSAATERDDVLRHFANPAIHGAERELRIAVATRELALEIWRLDGP